MEVLYRFVIFSFRACEALCQCLPDQLKDETFAPCLKEDKSTKHWLAQLLKNLENMGNNQQQQQQQQAGGNTGGGNAKHGGIANVKLPGGL